jgi:flagellin-like protein
MKHDGAHGKKGISPLIASVLLIGITILMAAIIGPWAIKLATTASEGAANNANQDMICRQTAYAYDGDFGVSGAAWNFSAAGAYINVKIINTGSQNLYNFSVELTVRSPTETKLLTYPSVNVTSETQRSKNNPLKPGHDWILESNVTGVDATWSLIKVKVINDVCPKVSPSLDI